MQPYALWIACGIAVAASATDIWRFKVHNSLTFPAALAGLVYHALAPWGGGWSYGLAGFAVGLGLLLVPYALGVFGAGDAKFVAAMGAWLGVQPLLGALVVGAVASGIYAVTILALRGGAGRAWANLRLTFWSVCFWKRGLSAGLANQTVQQAVRSDGRRGRLIPFSAMVGVGVVYVAVRGVAAV
ncbi:MAG: prepilin peptidase [Planctomycetota bacterium]